MGRTDAVLAMECHPGTPALLGQIPLYPRVMETSDSGQPIVVADPESSAARAMTAIAKRVGEQAGVPAKILNLAGAEMLRIREVADEFGKLLGKAAKFGGVEAGDALLSNAQEAYRLFGKPRVSAKQVINWVAEWVKRGGETLEKPTHFEARDGRF